MARYITDERNDRPLELGKDGLQLVGRQAGLGAVEQRIIGSLPVAERIGDLTVQLDVPFEIGLEQLEVRVLACLLPDRACGRAGASDLRDELSRQLARQVVIAAGDTNDAGVIGIERKAANLALRLLEQPAHLFRGEANVCETAQG